MRVPQELRRDVDGRSAAAEARSNVRFQCAAVSALVNTSRGPWFDSSPSPRHFVKQYARPAAGQRQHEMRDVRTEKALIMTTEYLIEWVSNLPPHPCHVRANPCTTQALPFDTQWAIVGVHLDRLRIRSRSTSRLSYGHDRSTCVILENFENSELFGRSRRCGSAPNSPSDDAVLFGDGIRVR